jgi:hypothetical protein
VRPLNLISQKFGRLTVLSRAENSATGKTRWKCICECGNEIITSSDGLKSGKSKSCGCYRAEKLSKIAIKKNTVHGQNKVGARTGAHKSWHNMRERCNDENHVSYKYYGGRGITVCERWNKFENFFEDMGERPEGKTLDRIDSNGNYEPGNCKWSTKSEQQKNKRSYTFRVNKITSSTGFKGVSKCRQTGKYTSIINVNKKRIHLGRFSTPEEASNAYIEAEKKYFGDANK